MSAKKQKVLDAFEQFDLFVQQQLNTIFGVDLAAEDIGSVDRLAEIDLTRLTVWDSLDGISLEAAGTAAEANTVAENVNPYVNLKIPYLDGRPQMLFLDSMQDDAALAGVEMPITRYLRQKGRYKNCIFVGVSGCGKTRTCFDLCRQQWALYFDCYNDIDFLAFRKNVAALVTRSFKKSLETQTEFESDVEAHILGLLLSRMVVLKWLKSHFLGSMTPYLWLGMQRSRRMLKVFLAVFYFITNDFVLDLFYVYQLVLQSVPDLALIFDECHVMEDDCVQDFRSVRNPDKTFAHGCIRNCRSLFSFFADRILQLQQRNIWCGTQFSIANIDIFHSAAASSGRMTVFTDFNYLEADNINCLLRQWLKLLPDDRQMDIICNMLQGRPRLITQFVSRLVEFKAPTVPSAMDVVVVFNKLVEHHTTNCGQNFGERRQMYLYEFWREHYAKVIEQYSPDGDNTNPPSRVLVADALITACVTGLFGRGSKSLQFNTTVDVISTGLAMAKADASDSQNFTFMMIEPLALMSGLNYIVDKDKDQFRNYYCNRLFNPAKFASDGAATRGHLMELVVLVRFMQGFWLDEDMKPHIPQWLRRLKIPRPLTVRDERNAAYTQGDGAQSTYGSWFLEQLHDPEHNFCLLPQTFAKPDVRYRNFVACVKTAWESPRLSAAASAKNAETSNWQNWYSAKQDLHARCQTVIREKQPKFFTMLFDLPLTNAKNVAKYDAKHTVLVQINSPIAVPFFGHQFVDRYKAWYKNQHEKSVAEQM